VKDGVIPLTGGGRPHLASVKAYGDFEMIFEWRALRGKYNSGFFIRARKNVGNTVGVASTTRAPARKAAWAGLVMRRRETTRSARSIFMACINETAPPPFAQP
jgi:hypothetical protein